MHRHRFDYPRPDSSSEPPHYCDIGAFDYPGKESLLGDVNYDGTIDLTDAVMATQVLIDYETAEPVNPDAELVDDIAIGLPDAIFILQQVSQ